MSRAIRGASLQAAALLTVVAALLGVTVGAAAGVGGYVFVYADGALPRLGLCGLPRARRRRRRGR